MICANVGLIVLAVSMTSCATDDEQGVYRPSGGEPVVNGSPLPGSSLTDQSAASTAYDSVRIAGQFAYAADNNGESCPDSQLMDTQVTSRPRANQSQWSEEWVVRMCDTYYGVNVDFEGRGGNSVIISDGGVRRISDDASS